MEIFYFPERTTRVPPAGSWCLVRFHQLNSPLPKPTTKFAIIWDGKFLSKSLSWKKNIYSFSAGCWQSCRSYKRSLVTVSNQKWFHCTKTRESNNRVDGVNRTETTTLFVRRIPDLTLTEIYNILGRSPSSPLDCDEQCLVPCDDNW